MVARRPKRNSRYMQTLQGKIDRFALDVNTSFRGRNEIVQPSQSRIESIDASQEIVYCSLARPGDEFRPLDICDFAPPG